MTLPRYRRAAPAALTLTLALLATGCGSQAGPAADAADTGASGTASGSDDAGTGSDAGSDAEVPAALDFTSETVAGEAFAGADLAGKPTVFWFWAPWCPTCHAQVSGVGELAATYGSDVNVVGVGALDEREAIEGFAENVSPDVTLLADPDGDVWRHLEVTAQSTYLVLDADGNEVASGYLDDAELVDVVDGVAG